jgi:hypothetical protein
MSKRKEKVMLCLKQNTRKLTFNLAAVCKEPEELNLLNIWNRHLLKECLFSTRKPVACGDHVSRATVLCYPRR